MKKLITILLILSSTYTIGQTVDTVRIKRGSGSGTSGIEDVIQGTGITINKSNPAKPVINAVEKTFSQYVVHPIVAINDSTIGFRSDSLPKFDYASLDTLGYLATTLIPKGYLNDRLAAFVGGSSWNITGNSGTSYGNFIGTTDLKSLWFRTNNIPRVVIDSTRGRVWIKSQVYKASGGEGSDYAFKVTDSLGSNLLSITETGTLNVGSLAAANVPTSGIINLLTAQNSSINFYGSNSLMQTFGLKNAGDRRGITIGDSVLFSENLTSSITIGRVATSPASAILDITSKKRGFLPPRLTIAERDLVNNGIDAGTLAGGSGYLNGAYIGLGLGGSGKALLIQVTVTGGVVTGLTILEQGVGYKVGDVITMFIPTGSGFSYTATSVIPPSIGVTLFCTDCTATDSSTGVMQTWNGTTWKNNW